MAGHAPLYSVILAAGKGTRMQSSTLPKVCFPVNGRPAICRAIDLYNRCGIRHHVIVVGALAGRVIETVGAEFDNVSFVYQREQSGTADAVRSALRHFDPLTEDPDLFLAAGDRIIDAPVLEQFFDLYYTRKPDLALMATPFYKGSGQGRLVFSQEGRLLAIVENADIRRHRAQGGFFEFREQGKPLLRKSPDEMDAAEWANNSIYLTRPSVLRRTLPRLTRDNAQGEEYLTDIVRILSESPGPEGGRCEMLKVTDRGLILGFNDPAQLLEAESILRARQSGRISEGPALSPWYRSVADWIHALESARPGGTGAMAEELAAIYGDDPAVLRERAEAWLLLLRHTAALLGTKTPVALVRSPGRVNAMGRHIDHQGGHCNLMTIGFETLMAAHARADDRVTLRNLDSARFPDRAISIREELAQLPFDDWLSLINSERVAALGRTYGGDWIQYTLAPVVRLQKKFPQTPLSGMDLVVSGNIPMAAGLSSSSSLVVATAEAAVALSGLSTFPSQFIDLCGEGEWFVGTRGGSADHAAVKSGERGKIIRVTFFDFAVEEAVPFPEGYALAVCDSRISAKKTENARDQFNHRIACYQIGFQLILRQFPQYAPLLRKLRDVNVRNLRVPLSWIYRILLHLPERATRAEIEALLSGIDLSRIFASHAAPQDGFYPVRGVVLFGLAECERARAFAPLLKSGNMDEIGRIMNVSHDGDRVARLAADGSMAPFTSPSDNARLLSLMEDLESGDPERVGPAQLYLQPGAYRCSLPEIDRMADLALSVPGVAGAQLAGAGLGGCMMVLVREKALPGLKAVLTEHYYAPSGRDPSILVCRPIAGSGVLLKH